MESPPASLSWRDRRRSRLAEVMDGAAMMYADVAVLRATVFAAVMLAVAFLARHRSGFAVALAVAAGAFVFAEMLNTLVEMLVDRISLEANVLSARIKHAAAFVSACVAAVAISLLALVLYQIWFGAAGGDKAGHADSTPTPTPPPPKVIGAPEPTQPASPAGLAPPLPHHGGGRWSSEHREEAPSGEAEPTQPDLAAAVGSAPPPPPSASAPASAPAPAPPPPPPCEFIMRWARLGATGSAAEPRAFVSRRVLHPLQWDSRVKHKRRYRRRVAGARHSTSRPSGVST